MALEIQRRPKAYGEYKMLKINYYIGLNDMDSHTQLIKNEEAYDLIVKILEEHGFYGATIYNASGLWYGETEATLNVEIVAPQQHVDDYTMANIGYAFQKEFNQLSVMVTVHELKTVHHFDYII